MKKFLFFPLVLSVSWQIFAQSQIESEGEVHALSGGFRFPDSTLQTTAAFNDELFTLTNSPRQCFLVLGSGKDKTSIPLVGIPQIGIEREISLSLMGAGDREATLPEQIEITLLKESDLHSLELFKLATLNDMMSPDTVSIEIFDENSTIFQSWKFVDPLFTKFLFKSIPSNGALINVEEITINTVEILFYQYGSTPSCFCYTFATAEPCLCPD